MEGEGRGKEGKGGGREGKGKGGEGRELGLCSSNISFKKAMVPSAELRKLKELRLAPMSLICLISCLAENV